jgi:hypothetical protein
MIDTPQKRLSALARRRLPWLRRFTLPIPDGTIDQGDRQHILGLYSGIAAGEPSEDVTLLHGWLEFTAAGRLHFDVSGQTHFDTTGRLHFTPGEED